MLTSSHNFNNFSNCITNLHQERITMILQKYARSKNALLLLMMLALACPTIELMADQEPRRQETTEKTVTQNDQNTNEEFFEEELPTWRKALHWYIAAGGCLIMGSQSALVYGFTEDACKAFPEKPLSPETHAHIQEIIRNNNINPETIIVKGTQLPEAMTAGALGKNGMLIDPKQVENFTKAQLEFVVSHELGHLKNKDNIKKAVLLLMSPFIAHYGLKAWDAGVHKLLSGIKSTLGVAKDSRTAQVISKIDYINHWLSTFCITKALLAGQIFNAYSRYCENQADRAAISQLKTDEGAESFFKKAQEQYKLMRETKPFGKWFINEKGDNILPVTHPRPSERIENTRAWAEVYAKAAPTSIEAPVIVPVEVIPANPAIVPMN